MVRITIRRIEPVDSYTGNGYPHHNRMELDVVHAIMTKSEDEMGL